MAITDEEFPRLIELANRLTMSGGKAAHVSMSELHEVAEGLHDLVAELTRARAVVLAAEKQNTAFDDMDTKRAGRVRGDHGPADPAAYERARDTYETACAETCDAVDTYHGAPT